LSGEAPRLRAASILSGTWSAHSAAEAVEAFSAAPRGHGTASSWLGGSLKRPMGKATFLDCAMATAAGIARVNDLGDEQYARSTTWLGDHVGVRAGVPHAHGRGDGGRRS
jgi:hypothetical protein